jgi:hypothetical protein
MADLNDLNKPDTMSRYDTEVWQTFRGHIGRLWSGDYTGMANLVVGMRRWVRNANNVDVMLVQRNSTGGESTIFDSALKANASEVDAAIATLIPAGTRMPFAQASAPTGWTQDTSDRANNRMLRVVNTAGNGIGGSASPILNNVVPAHTHGFTTGTVSADHAHYVSGNTGGQSADHTHNYSAPIERFSAGGVSLDDRMPVNSYQTSGTSNDHTHAFIALTNGSTSNHTHSGSTDNGSSQTNWAPRYIDMIICSKN